MKIALVIGHNEKKQGAYSKHLNYTEFEFYKKVVLNLTPYNSVGVYFHNPNIKSYTKRIKATMKQVNKTDYDLVICLHFNSFNSIAHGCETLYYFNSKKGKQHASRFSRFINTELGIRYRGIKALTNKKDRGFASVKYTKAPTILIEPFFGDNKEDCEKIQSAENFAKVLTKFINNI